MRLGRGVVAGALALMLAAALPGLAGADDARPPMNYVTATGLSTAQFPATVRTVHEVLAVDGTDLYLEVVMPDPAVYGARRWPVIFEASPYHGTIADRSGTRIFPDPVDQAGAKLGLTGFFAPRGYAVAMMNLRGTGRSGGCLDHLGQLDASDLRVVVEWLADQAWSTGRIGMTGHSYVGATQVVAAAQRPRGLVTIATSAGLASMYDHQFQHGVPYNLQYVGPQIAYEGLALSAELPSQVPAIPVVGGPTGDDFMGHPESAGCGMTSSAALAGTGQVTGQYEAWHGQRDWRAAVTDVDIPIFMIHGVNDNAARIPAAEWFFGGRFGRDGDKVWIGQWDHGSTNSACRRGGLLAQHPTCRFQQWQGALHAWFDFHLQQRPVDTGPAVEAFLNDEFDAAPARGPVYTAGAWEEPQIVTELHLDASSAQPTLSLTPPTAAGTVEFPVRRVSSAVTTGTDGPTFSSAPLERETVFLGLAELSLQASLTTSQVAHLVMTLNRVDSAGISHPMGYCAIQPSLRFGVATFAPVVPGQEMRLTPQCFTLAHHAQAGDVITLTIADSSPHHVAAAVDANMTVFTGPGHPGSVRLPTVVDPVTHADPLPPQ